MWPFYILVGIFVVASIVSSNKKAKAAKAKAEQEAKKASSNIEGTTGNSNDVRESINQNRSFDEIMAEIKRERNAKTASTITPKTVTSVREIQKSNYSNDVKVETKPKSVTSNKPQVGSVASTIKESSFTIMKHRHPAESQNSVVEKAALGTNSLGGDSTEGCIDHRDERFISNDEAYLDLEDENSMSIFQRLMVFGPLIETPRCKKSLRK